MRRSARVVTVSFSSRRDILRVYRLPDRHVEAIHLAAPPELKPMPRDQARKLVGSKFGLDGPFLLSVGVLQPRKNFPMLIEAFAIAVHKYHLPYKLVLVGKRGWAYDEIAVQIARLRVADRVLLTDYVEDSDLPALYSAADLMVFPSLYEGFGLPPLEAMACGTPTVVSDAPAMPEVAGEGALVLPVMDAQSWAEAMARLTESPAERDDLAQRALQRSQQFAWAATAARTRAVYRQVAGASTTRLTVV